MEYMVNERGERTRVVLSVEEYERLQEAADELEDIRVFDEAMAEQERGEDDPVPWEKVKDRIGSEFHDE